MLKKIKDNLIYYYLILVMILFVLLPKEIGVVFGFIHIRLLLIFGIFIVYIYDYLTKSKKLKKFNKVLFVFCIIFILLLSLGIFNVINKIMFIYTLLKLSSFLGLIFVLQSYKFDKKEKDNFLKCFVLVSLIISFVGILQYIFDINIIRNGINKYPGSKGRIGGTFHNVIYFGIFLLCSINILLYKLGKKLDNKNKFLCFFILITNSIALFFTYTRTVALLLICIVCGYLFFALINKNKKKILKYFGILLSIVFLIFAVPGAKYLYSSTFFNLIPSSLVNEVVELLENITSERIDLSIYNEVKKPIKPGIDGEIIDEDLIEEGITEEKDEEAEVSDYSVATRKEFGHIALNVIKNNSITGIGLGNYEKYVKSNSKTYITDRFGYPHNSFLHLTAESGVITGFVFAIIIVLLVVTLLIKSFVERNESVICLFLISISLFVLAFFESFIYDTQLCPLIILMFYFLFEEYKLSPKKSDVMFISSVGGHLTQMLELKSLFNKYSYVLITEYTDVTNGLKEKYNVSYLPYCSRNQKYTYPFILLWNCIKSLYYIIKYNPQVIITTGANTAAAMCCLGKLFGKKVIFIESYAKRTSPTITGKFIYKLHAYTTFIVQWEGMLKYYPKAVYWGGIY